MTSTDDEIDLPGFAGAVAAHLEGFSVDTSWGGGRWSVPLDGPNGARIFLSLSKGRVEVSGAYPTGYYQTLGSQEHHEITVALSRGPVVIAREIVRRLLPGYLETLAEVQEKMRLDREAKNTRQAAAERLADALPAASVSTHRDAEVHWYASNRAGYGTARVNFGGATVTLDINSLPIDVAERVLRVLAEEVK